MSKSAGNSRPVSGNLTIPLHNEIDKGTLKAIFRQALRYIPEGDLYPHFYTDNK